MFKTFVITGHEMVREGTFQFYIDVKVSGNKKEQIRVIVYPDGYTKVFGPPESGYLQSDLSEAQQKKLLAEVAKISKKAGA